jgi:hypothetical protein
VFSFEFSAALFDEILDISTSSEPASAGKSAPWKRRFQKSGRAKSEAHFCGESSSRSRGIVFAKIEDHSPSDWRVWCLSRRDASFVECDLRFDQIGQGCIVRGASQIQCAPRRSHRFLESPRLSVRGR